MDRTVDLADEFEEVDDGCFVMLDMATGMTIRYNARRCAERFPPCSTFKVPNSLIGLDTGVISGPDHTYEWDGIERGRDVLNQDHTLRSAIRHSVVWYYQRLAAEVGAETMQNLIDRFDYGNRDLASGLTTFWLMQSLRISPNEQVRFLDQLTRHALPVSEDAQRIVNDIMILETRDGRVLRGKTGSGYIDEAANHGLGWFVGSVTRGDRRWIFATNIEGPGAFGAAAQAITLRILEELGV